MKTKGNVDLKQVAKEDGKATPKKKDTDMKMYVGFNKVPSK